MKVADIFAGAGGFARGFIEEKFEVVVAIDNFKHAVNTYKENFDTDVFQVDVKNFSGKILKDYGVEMIIASPPCEAFTKANERRFEKPEDRLFKDKRGTLTLEFIRILKEAKPDFFIMESVPGILELKGILSKLFKKAGYDVYFNVLKAEDFSTPSKRTRVFVSNMEIKPEKGKKVKVIEAISNIPNDAPNNFAKKLSKKKEMEISRLRWGEALYGFRGSGKSFGNWIRLHPYRLAPTVLGNSRFVHPFENRLLTVREQARLMGFPDDHVFKGGIETQYELVGEAVPPTLSRAIAKAVRKVI